MPPFLRLPPAGEYYSITNCLPDILECGGNLTEIPTGIRGARGNRRVGSGLLTRRRFGFGDAFIPSKGVAVREKRRRRGTCKTRCPGSYQPLLIFPVAKVRFDRAALPAYSKADAANKPVGCGERNEPHQWTPAVNRCTVTGYQPQVSGYFLVGPALRFAVGTGAILVTTNRAHHTTDAVRGRRRRGPAMAYRAHRILRSTRGPAARRGPRGRLRRNATRPVF